ncbi:MAG: lytic murein transglycosylase [Patescibacteria group bacterium]|nr:lytic murein transglycosylase [Patescibacteria group bacterium]
MLKSLKNFVLFGLLVGLFFNLFTPSLFADQPYSQSEREQLQQQLDKLEAQITQYQKELAQTKNQAKTLANKIYQLKKQQEILQLQIEATTSKISQVALQIYGIQNAIALQQQHLDKLKSEISELILLLWQHDQYPFFYYLVMSNSISDIFDSVNNYSEIIGGLQRVTFDVTATKNNLEKQQVALEDQQSSMNNLLVVKSLQQSQLSGSVNEQKNLLTVTKGKESNYQKIVADAKGEAAKIKNRIYQLLDVSTKITFGQAYQIADWVSRQTGVRPAFLLAILTQESNLGKNVGTCNRLGDPPSKSWKVIMKPSRDQQPFLAITKELGMDPNVTPVSCPMRDKSGNQIGWGGAMGPAQFIPSTWLGYKNKVSQLTGSNPANPWDIRDAFVASAIKLKADGANGTRQGEWNAAMRYFSGSTNPAYSFYGDNVLALADGYQADIDQLSK